MVFEGANGTFGGIGAMFFGWNTLEGHVVFLEGVFEFLGAFVVKDVKLRCMALSDEACVGKFPSIADAGGFSIGDGSGMDRIGIVMIQNENVVVAATRRDREFASLVRIGFEKLLLRKYGSTNVVCVGFEHGSNVGIHIGKDGQMRSTGDCGGAQVLGFLILVAQGSGDARR